MIFWKRIQALLLNIENALNDASEGLDTAKLTEYFHGISKLLGEKLWRFQTSEPISPKEIGPYMTTINDIHRKMSLLLAIAKKQPEKEDPGYRLFLDDFYYIQNRLDTLYKAIY